MTREIKTHKKIDDYNIEQKIRNNIQKLSNKNGLIRDKARRTLEEIGLPAIDFLAEYVDHPDVTARWEAVKALGEINEPVAAPLLVNALEDNDGDVRWLAAEGLAALGEEGLIELFNTLFTNSDSIYLRKGAHHVLSRIAEDTKDTDVKELMQILDAPDADLKILLKGRAYLERISRKHSEGKM